MKGVALLEDGRWLVTGGDDKIAIMDPASMPKGKHVSVFDDPALDYPYNFNYIGRACLSEEFVASRAQVEPEASCEEPAGAVLFAENFESDDFTMAGDDVTYHGFDVLKQDGVTVSLDTTQSVEGNGRSLKIAGGSGDLYDLPSGVHKELGSELKPSYLSYYLRIDTTDFSGGHFALNDAPEESLDTLLVYNGNFRTFQSFGSTTVEKDKWIHVQLRDFDWEEMTYDVYVDCKRVFDDMSFSPYGGTSLHALEMFNFTETAVSWFDNIVIK
jgi:hypothetical protein